MWCGPSCDHRHSPMTAQPGDVSAADLGGVEHPKPAGVREMFRVIDPHRGPRKPGPDSRPGLQPHLPGHRTATGTAEFDDRQAIRREQFRGAREDPLRIAADPDVAIGQQCVRPATRSRQRPEQIPAQRGRTTKPGDSHRRWRDIYAERKHPTLQQGRDQSSGTATEVQRRPVAAASQRPIRPTITAGQPEPPPGRQPVPGAVRRTHPTPFTGQRTIEDVEIRADHRSTNPCARPPITASTHARPPTTRTRRTNPAETAHSVAAPTPGRIKSSPAIPIAPDRARGGRLLFRRDDCSAPRWTRPAKPIGSRQFIAAPARGHVARRRFGRTGRWTPRPPGAHRRRCRRH